MRTQYNSQVSQTSRPNLQTQQEQEQRRARLFQHDTALLWRLPRLLSRLTLQTNDAAPAYALNDIAHIGLCRQKHARKQCSTVPKLDKQHAQALKHIKNNACRFVETPPPPPAVPCTDTAQAPSTSTGSPAPCLESARHQHPVSKAPTAS